MKKQRKTLLKKCISVLLAFCLLLSDSRLMTLAEGQEGYSFSFQCVVGTENIMIPDVSIVLYEEVVKETDPEGENEPERVQVPGTNGTFRLSAERNTYII